MNDITVGNGVRARLGARPGDSSAAQLVLLDHHMVPDRADVDRWIVDARHRGFSALRTSALFPRSSRSFLDAGFTPVDRLALLERDLRGSPGRWIGTKATRRMRRGELVGAAEIDRAAFGSGWCNDADSLLEIRRATPRHRSRVIGSGRVVAFAISGRSGPTGYLQRLAVDPAEQGLGLGRTLVGDALSWMVRHGAVSALVNTGLDNERALALYKSEGFTVRPDELVVLERSLDR